MNFYSILLTSFFFLFLVSCSQDEIEATNHVRDEATVEALISKKQKFYRANTNELRSKRDSCRQASKEEMNSIDCIAAFREGIFL